MIDRPQVIIIGGGFTGTATAYDLALRGYEVTVYERGEIASGTSGRTHGLLHSGGRYCVNDRESAQECIRENLILKRIAGQCIEANGGFFVALNEAELDYGQLFVRGAEECGISVEGFSGDQIRKLEPHASDKIIYGYSVPDASFDPLRLAWAFCAGAAKAGAFFKTYHEVQGLGLDGKGRASTVTVLDRVKREVIEKKADLIINACGAWSGQITAMLGLPIGVRPTPGIMVAIDKRFTQRVFNRLNIPDDGDIVIPQRRMLVIGTTSFEVNDVDYIPLDANQAQQMIDSGAEMIPAIKNARRRGVYMSSRPLVDEGMDARSLTRTFKILDHELNQNIPGLISIIGGKATTCRLMAEKVSDLACQKLGLNQVCETAEQVLPSYRTYLRAA